MRCGASRGRAVLCVTHHAHDLPRAWYPGDPPNGEAVPYLIPPGEIIVGKGLIYHHDLG